MHVELLYIMTLVRNANPISDRDVRVIVDKYFTEEVKWSLLKDEWNNRMSEEQKTAFCVKILTDATSV